MIIGATIPVQTEKRKETVTETFYKLYYNYVFFDLEHIS